MKKKRGALRDINHEDIVAIYDIEKMINSYVQLTIPFLANIETLCELGNNVQTSLHF